MYRGPELIIDLHDVNHAARPPIGKKTIVTKTSTIRKPFPNQRVNRREISCRQRKERTANQERQERRYQPWDYLTSSLSRHEQRFNATP